MIFPAKIDDPFDIARHLRHWGNGLKADDFANLEDSYPVGFLMQFESQVFAGRNCGCFCVGTLDVSGHIVPISSSLIAG